MYELIPDELKALKNWVCWRAEPDPKSHSGIKKVPINPRTGYGAKSNDASTWSDFNTATAAAVDYAGIGFMFKDSGYFGIDIDDRPDELAAFKAGDRNNTFGIFIDRMQSYAEISQSGNGVHIICKGVLPGKDFKNGEQGIEMYAGARFFIMTGNLCTDYVDIADGTDSVIALYEQYKTGSDAPQQMPLTAAPVDLDTAQIIERAQRSSNGQKFAALYAGDYSAYGSQSEADMAFCNMLAFWCGGDLDKISGKMQEVAQSIANLTESMKTTAANIWNGLKENLSGIMDGIKNTVSAAWNGIKTAVTAAADAVKSVVTAVWNAIKSVVSAVQNAIHSDTGSVWERIKIVISAAVNAVKSVITAVWTAIQGFIGTTLGAISSTVSSIWNSISSTISSLMNSIKTTVLNIWDSVKSGVTSRITGIKDSIQTGLDSAVTYIKSLATNAFSWGADIISGIKNGIQSKIKEVKDAVTGVADTIKSHLHFSVPDTGPLTDFPTWMPDMMHGLADGIEKNMKYVKRAVNDLAENMIPSVDLSTALMPYRAAAIRPPQTAAPATSTGYPMQSAGTVSNVFNFTIHVQQMSSDYDVRRAAEVMAEEMERLTDDKNK